MLYVGIATRRTMRLLSTKGSKGVLSAAWNPIAEDGDGGTGQHGGHEFVMPLCEGSGDGTQCLASPHPGPVYHRPEPTGHLGGQGRCARLTVRSWCTPQGRA